MSVIDPDRHARLLKLQQTVYAATDRLYAYDGDCAEPLREEVRQAVEAKDAVLHESGLVAEYGYHTASQDLKRAAHAAG